MFLINLIAPATLTTVTPEICQDKAPPGKASDCTLYPELCYNPIYMKLMKEQCPKTCGYCDQITTTKSRRKISAACQDKEGPDGKSNCKEVKYLCNVPIYMPLILIQCPHTCGLC
ncbi:unnamed protein product [Thelazia callipaeda]|uniref:ShTK domain protein n=1 Tax=Thelazia callipaeda TaxID=103827 RepID=A0A0N5D8I7_THECL|nr:unnamed protein product [Thelazia callipaeda]